MKKKYCAIYKDAVYKVAIIHDGDFEICGDIRAFATFEEANQTAKDMATGKYGYQAGDFVDMR
jgi:hypothetical protein